MSSISSSLRANGRTIGVRVEPEVYQALQTVARRHKMTVTAYCRDVLSAHVKAGKEEATPAGLHRIAMKTLEDVQWLKHTLVTAMAILLKEQYLSKNIGESERERALAAMSEEQRQKADPAAITRANLLLNLMREAESAKRDKARARLSER